MSFDREAFIDGYVEAALWADGQPVMAEGEDAEFGGLEHLTIRPEAREEMAKDCRKFIDENYADLIAYSDVVRSRIAPHDPPESYAGHDFWLTRRGHGAGFWDRDLGELGDRLTKAAGTFPEEPPLPYDCGDSTATIDIPANP